MPLDIIDHCCFRNHGAGPYSDEATPGMMVWLGRIRARAFVDCSADADVAAGAEGRIEKAGDI